MAKQTWIYLIKDLFTGYYKIGYSNYPIKRLVKLRKQDTLMPLPNDFILGEAWIGNTNDEANLHKLFREKRIRGEWFKLGCEELFEVFKYFEDSRRYNETSRPEGFRFLVDIIEYDRKRLSFTGQ